VCLFLVAVTAGALRAIHLGATSLWWDEIVQVQTAALPSFADVLWRVRAGDPPGLGNAGAVPIDYLLMHGYLSLVPRPAPEHLEIYYRLPAWAFSTLAVGAVFLYARRFFGRAEALASSLFLATSVPHALYGAEARFYSLFTFVTVLCLWAFSRVAATPRRRFVWVVHAAVGVLTFLTGLLGILLLAGQYAVLALILGSDILSRRPSGEVASSEGHGQPSLRRALRPLAALAVSAAAIAAVVVVYYSETWVLVRLHRLNEISWWDATRDVFSYFTLESPLALALFLVSLAVVPIAALRGDRTERAIALHLVTSFLWVPILSELAGWKGYYVRPRHALFLLPYFALVVGIGLCECLRFAAASRWWRPRARDGRPARIAMVAAAIVLAVQIVPVVRFVADPFRDLNVARPTRDVASLMQRLAERASALPPGEAYLLIAEQRRPAYLANPEIAWYLRQYGLTDRVLLRTIDASETALDRIEARCNGGCPARNAAALSMALGLGGSIDLRPSLSELLGVDQPMLPPRLPVARVGVLRHRPDPRTGPSALHWTVLTRRGWTLFETELDEGHAPGPARRTGQPG
jgi:hypothetical protein